jgi:SAM-dependent methyltransferase
MKSFWNERYDSKEYIYGKEANVFFAEQLGLLTVGEVILPCEGEGRNAVYAASLGWKVNAFDSSEYGKAKALQLVFENKVSINYDIDDATNISYPENSVDVVALIYAHFPVNIRKQIHQKTINWLKLGGKILIEAFNPLQLQNNSGGPKDHAMLYTIDMLKEDFEGLTINLLEYNETILNEGTYHNGKANIIRFIGTKI